MPPRELARLYDAHAASLAAHLRALLREDADVRDVIQELFQKLAARPDLLREVRDERAYLLRLAHHAGIDLCRRQAARGRAHEALAEEIVGGNSAASWFAPATDPDEAAFRVRLAEALSELPVEQRTVVQLKLWEGLTFEKIAEVIGIPLNTAASRYRYGLDKLRTLLRPLYDEIR